MISEAICQSCKNVLMCYERSSMHLGKLISASELDGVEVIGAFKAMLFGCGNPWFFSSSGGWYLSLQVVAAKCCRSDGWHPMVFLHQFAPSVQCSFPMLGQAFESMLTYWKGEGWLLVKKIMWQTRLETWLAEGILKELWAREAASSGFMQTRVIEVPGVAVKGNQ